MSWWRTQRVALIALAAAVVAAAGAYVWLDVIPAMRPSDRVVEADGPVDIAGQTLSLATTEWAEFDAPDGSRTLSIRLDASGGADAELCGTTTLTEESSGRTWLSSRDGLDVPYDLGETSCITEAAPYGILLVFLLPDDVEPPLLLDIEGADGDVARFVVDP